MHEEIGVSITGDDGDANAIISLPSHVKRRRQLRRYCGFHTRFKNSASEAIGSMRFFEDGPDIPGTLIEARELGEVVFFCGAGVSAPAGLPDFDVLANDLLVKLTA